METKKRHGCVTAWLILMIVVNSATALFYLLAGEFISKNSPVEISSTMILLLGILGFANVFFAVLLLKWRKTGFWGFVATSIIALFINLGLGLGIGQSLSGLIGIAVLYGVLQIKVEEETAWNNLE
jgi:hypothetical protein